MPQKQKVAKGVPMRARSRKWRYERYRREERWKPRKIKNLMRSNGLTRTEATRVVNEGLPVPRIKKDQQKEAA